MDHALVAAVVDVIEERAVAFHRVGRPQDFEIGRVLDAPALVARREANVDDAAVARVRGIEFAVEAPDDAYVRARCAEGFASGEGSRAFDLHSCYFSFCKRTDKK